MTDALSAAANLYEQAAAQLDLAAQHCRIAAAHLREREVPRGAAHAWAAHGHDRNARALLDDAARRHAAGSLPQR
jgi:hypothetical protein